MDVRVHDTPKKNICFYNMQKLYGRKFDSYQIHTHTH